MKNSTQNSVISSLIPILIMNQMGSIYHLQQAVANALEDNDSKKAKEVLELILKIQVNPIRSIFDMAMLGVIPSNVSAQELEVAIRSGLTLQYQMELPQLIKKIFDAKLVTVDELAELTKSETAVEIIACIKQLALDETNPIDYSELALVLAIKQKDWDYVLNSNLLIEGQLADHEELLADIYDANRFDILDECKEYNVFSIDEDFYADLDSQDENGETLLMQAASSGDVKEVKRLLALGANPAIKDKTGSNALMYAVMHSVEELANVNVADSKRTPEIKKLMGDKAQIVKILISDKRVNVNERNSASINAFDIAISQGLVTSDKGVAELRGNHLVIDALLNGGANPIFGEFEWSFKAKTMMTLFLSVALTGLKNHLINATGIGIVFRVVLSPLIEVLNIACDAVVAYKAYYDVKNSLYTYTRTCLDSEYASDAFFSLDKKPLIGAFHINWMGQVYSGESLKNFMANHVGYQSVANGYFSSANLPRNEDGSVRMTVKDKLALSNEIANRFDVVQSKLNGFMMPWTREAMENISNELKEAYELVQNGYKLPNNMVVILDEIISQENQDRVVAEISSNVSNLNLFFQIYSAVKSGALGVSLETRYNLEKVAVKLKQAEAEEKSFSQKLVEYAKPKNQVSKYSFADLSCEAQKFEISGFMFGQVLQVMQHEFSKDLAENRDVRSIKERMQDGAVNLFHNIVNRVADGAAYVCGTDRATVLDVASEGIARVGASANATAHVGARRFYDSSYFIPACIMVGMAYLTVKFPDRMWTASKCTFKALVVFASFVVSAISCLFSCISGAISYLKPKEASTALNIVAENKQPVVVIGDDVMKGMIESTDRQISGTQIAVAA